MNRETEAMLNDLKFVKNAIKLLEEENQRLRQENEILRKAIEEAIQELLKNELHTL